MREDRVHDTVDTPDGAAATMRAIVRSRYGPPEALELKDVPRPGVGDDEVLVRVRAASVGPWDWHRMTGEPHLVRLVDGLLRPRRPGLGSDLAGTVERVGNNVTGFSAGDDVYGDCDGRGSFAEYVSVPARLLAHKPAGLGFEEAASLPVAGLTAIEGLIRKGGVRSGQRVLVVGASGGVGTLAVQIAKLHGAEVTGVCSTGNVDLVRSLGADHVIDYTRDDFTNGDYRYDVIFDAVADRPLLAVRRVLAPRGVYVMVSGPKRRWVGPIPKYLRAIVGSWLVGQRVEIVIAPVDGKRLEELTAWVEEGGVRPVIDQLYELDDVPEVLRLQGEGHASGKRVVRI